MTSSAFRDKQAQDYVNEAKEVYKLLEEEKESKVSSLTTPDKQGYFYMVSSSWFDAFKTKTSFRDLEDGSMITANDIDMNVTLPTMNEDLIDREKCREITKVQNLVPEFAWLDIVLKYGLTEDSEYVLVKDKLWKYLKTCYPGSVEIKRARYLNHMHEECAEIYLIPAHFYFYTSGFVRDQMRAKKTLPETVYFQFSLSMTGFQVNDIALAIMRKAETYIPKMKNYLPFSVTKDSFQIMHMPEGEESITELNTRITKSEDEVRNMLVKGHLLPKKEVLRSSNLRFSGGEISYFVVEAKMYHNFVFKSTFAEEEDASDDSDGNNRYNKKNNYNSNNYNSNNYNYNKPKDTSSTYPSSGSSNYKSQSRMIESQYEEKEISSYSRKGVVGLKNIGNTCYMNSALQCLSNCTELTQYFLDKKYKSDKNSDNPLGSKCKLVEAFAALINKMWYGSDDKISPTDFKYEMGNFQPAFEGMSQHDSQELLSRLLDGLHEDLNLIQKKPYIEDNNDYKLADDSEALARKFWINFLRRNYSKIVELFYGQFRTKNKCPKCENTFIRYDSYELISLPVPKKAEEIEHRFSAFFINSNHSVQASKISLICTSNHGLTIKKREMLEQVAKVRNNGTTADDYIMVFSGFSTHGDIIRDTQSSRDIEFKCSSHSYRPRLFLFELNEQEKTIANDPDHILVFGLMKLKESEYDSTSHPGFTKVIPALLLTKIKDLYYDLFLKFAHYVNMKNVTKNKDLMEVESFPVQVDDYQAVFRACQSDVFKHKFVFRIKAGNEYLNFDSEETIESVINKYKDDLDFDDRDKVLKLDLWLDPLIMRESLVAVDYMKKVASEDLEVKVKKTTTDMDEESTLTIEGLMKRFIKEEELDDENKYRCPHCKTEVNAKREINIYKVPKYLILHMKKLKSGWSRYSGSDSLMVEFPVTNLDLTNLVVNKSPIECYNIEKKEFMDANNQVLSNRESKTFEWPEGKALKYNLFGVINHYGSMHFGHYTAYAKNGGKWYCYDDSNVTPIQDENKVVTEAAYVLFYERID